MAYGEAIGRIGGSFYEPGSQGQAKWNLVGGVADLGLSFIQNKRDQDMAEAAMAYQTQLAQAQYNLASKAAADEALADTVKKANEDKEELRKEMDEKITTLMGDMA